MVWGWFIQSEIITCKGWKKKKIKVINVINHGTIRREKQNKPNPCDFMVVSVSCMIAF